MVHIVSLPGYGGFYKKYRLSNRSALLIQQKEKSDEENSIYISHHNVYPKRLPPAGQ